MTRYFSALALLVLVSCSGPPKAAYTAVRVAAVTVRVADVAVTEAMEAVSEAATDLDSYERRMAPWRTVERAVAHARSAVLVLATVLDAWRAGAAEDRDWFGAAACLVPALEAVAQALQRQGVELPELRSALELIRPFATVLCPGSG